MEQVYQIFEELQIKTNLCRDSLVLFGNAAIPDNKAKNLL
jgi:hypothetical protein